MRKEPDQIAITIAYAVLAFFWLSLAIWVHWCFAVFTILYGISSVLVYTDPTPAEDIDLTMDPNEDPNLYL